MSEYPNAAQAAPTPGVTTTIAAGEVAELVERLRRFKTAGFQVQFSRELNDWLLSNAELRRSAATALETLQRQLSEAREALDEARKRMRNCRGAIESNQVVDKDVHGGLTRGMADIDAALASIGRTP